MENHQREFEDLKVAVRGLTMAVQHMKSSIENLADNAKNSVHISVVSKMFGVVVLSIAGIEGAQWFFKSYLPTVYGTPAMINTPVQPITTSDISGG